MLITLVLRKLLASSTFAIAGTLRSLISRLEDVSASIGFTEEDLEEIEELEEEWASDEEETKDNEFEIDPKLLKEELGELRRFAALAEGIRVNTKGEALIPALKMAFSRAESIGAQRKAVVRAARSGTCSTCSPRTATSAE